MRSATCLRSQLRSRGAQHALRVRQTGRPTWHTPAISSAQFSCSAQISPQNAVDKCEWVDKIGKTPLVRLDGTQLHAKLEGYNPGTSVKDRAITGIVGSLLSSGSLHPKNGTIVLVTSGSAAVSLNALHKQLRELEGIGFDVVVVFPAAYRDREVPARVIAEPEVTVYEGIDALLEERRANGGTTSASQKVLLVEGVFMDVLAEVEQVAAKEGWTMLEQHYDEQGLEAHRSTAEEVLASLPDVTDVVCSTGTGATAAGLRKFLPSHVQVHARPSAPGAIDGLSDVNRYSNFCDTDKLAGYDDDVFEPDVALEGKDDLLDEYGIEAGPSTGATFWLAKQIVAEDPDAKVVFISADGRLHPDTEPLVLSDESPTQAEFLPVTPPPMHVGEQPSAPTVSPVAKTRSDPLIGNEQRTAREGSDSKTVGQSVARMSTLATEHDLGHSTTTSGVIMDTPSLSTRLVCSGCGEHVDAASTPAFGCPSRHTNPGVDHVLVPASDSSAALDAPTNTGNPFIDYRGLMLSHRVAMARGMTDADYVALVTKFDEALAAVDGTGFRETPLTYHSDLNLFVKDETRNVGQSHKARHLANVMIYLLVLRETGGEAGAALAQKSLAVASCGNAGLAAAVVAAAAKWPIHVCIPPDADPAVQARLHELGAEVHVCQRDGTPVQTSLGMVDTTNAADPTLSACQGLVADHGCIPFSVQGPECGVAVEGGQTLGFELLAALNRDHPDVDHIGNVFVQVGGGALGAGLMQGLHRGIDDKQLPHGVAGLTSVPALRTVQPTGNAPLAQAFDRLQAERVTAAAAAKRRDDFMSPWPEPQSVAHGILDDETYEWVALCEAMQATGGSAITVSDDTIQEAFQFARGTLGIQTCHTGAASLAGWLSLANATPREQPDVVIVTGADRSQH